MSIPPSSFYYRAKEKPLKKLREDAGLRGRIEKISLEFPWYGYRRVTIHLYRDGWTVNHRRALKN